MHAQTYTLIQMRMFREYGIIDIKSMSVEPQLLQIVMNGLQSNEYALSWNDDFDFNDDKPDAHHIHQPLPLPSPTPPTTTQPQKPSFKPFPSHIPISDPHSNLLLLSNHVFLCFLHEQKQNTVSINIYVCINNMPAIFCQFLHQFASTYLHILMLIPIHTRFVLLIVALLQRSKNDELPTILLKIKQSKCHTCNRLLLDHILKSIIFNKLHRDHALYYQRVNFFSILSAIFIHLKCVLLCIICINRMFVTILQIKSSYCYCLNVPLVIT